MNIKMYFSQLICWVCVVSISKCILFSFQIIIPSFLESVGEFILSPLKNSPNLKLIFIMILIPAVLNATQVYYLLYLSSGYRTISWNLKGMMRLLMRQFVILKVNPVVKSIVWLKVIKLMLFCLREFRVKIEIYDNIPVYN